LEIVGRRSGEFYQIANQLLKHEVELVRIDAAANPTAQVEAEALKAQIASERMSLHTAALSSERSA